MLCLSYKKIVQEVFVREFNKNFNKKTKNMEYIVEYCWGNKLPI